MVNVNGVVGFLQGNALGCALGSAAEYTVSISDALLLAPVKYLYLAGPGIAGCWHGLPLPDVCAGLTGVRASFWAATPESMGECHAAIDAHVWSYLVPLYVAAYFWALYKAFAVFRGALLWLQRAVIKWLFYFFFLENNSFIAGCFISSVLFHQLCYARRQGTIKEHIVKVRGHALA